MLCSLAARSALLCARRTNVQQLNNLKMFAPLRSSGKTPIQIAGWEYLQQQKKLARPLSPHLTVYKPQLTWMVSGAFRIAGVIMGGTIVIGACGLLVLPFDFTEGVNYIRSLNLPMPLKEAFKFVVAWFIVFHSLNGARFLGFNLAKGTEIVTVYKTGYLVLGLATIIALGLVAWCGNEPLPPTDYKRKIQ